MATKLIAKERQKITKRANGTLRIVSINDSPSLTKQEFKDDCDPTKVLAKFQRTGLMEHAQQYQPVFGIQSSMTYHEAMQITANSKSMFAELPAQVRKLFDQNIEAYLEFVSDPENVIDMADDGVISLTNKAEIKEILKAKAAEAVPLTPETPPKTEEKTEEAQTPT